MNEAIAHFLPLDIRELCARILGDLFGGFADDLHAAHEGAFEDFVAEERHVVGPPAGLLLPQWGQLTSSSPRLLQQRLGVLQIARIKALGEPGVDLGEQRARRVALSEACVIR